MHRPMLAVAACLLFAAGLVGCNSATPTPSPTATPEATATDLPTDVPPTDTPEPELATRENPLELANYFILTNNDDGWRITFGPNDVLVGDEAMAALKEANQFNSEPPEGTQHVLVKLFAKVEGDGAPDSLTKWNAIPFAIVANGRAIDGTAAPAVVLPEPKFLGEIIPPGEIEGWAHWLVPVTDDLEMVFLREGDRGGYWFSLDK